MGYYDVVPGWAIFALPLFMLLAIAASLGVGLWLSALNVEYRDVRYTIPFLTQFWMLATPVAYPITIVPDEWHAIYGLNPMVGVVEGFRWALLGTSHVSATAVVASACMTSILLIGGLFFFRRMEKTFADFL